MNHFLYNESYFESRVTNASDLEPFFHNSTNFESKILERVIFRKKMVYTAWDFEVELYKTDFDECFAFRKSLFWISLAHENANFCSYAFSQKPSIGEKSGRKNSFLSRLLKRIRFRKKVFNNASDFESRKSNYVRISVKSTSSSFFESEFLESVRFWNILFTTRQILNIIFNNATAVHVKLILKSQICLDNSLSKILLFFGQFTP